MTRQLKVMALSAFILTLCTGPVSAYNSTALNIRVNDNGTSTSYISYAENVAELFEENKIEIDNGDIIDKPMDYTFESPETINITRAFPIIINLDGVPRMVKTIEPTVGLLMETVEETFDTDYVLEGITEESSLSNNMVINITSKKENIYSITEAIPFATEIKNNDNMAYGTEKITQEGSFGEVEITMKETYLGKLKKTSEEVGRAITKPAVNTIVEKGTAKLLSTNVGSVKYEKAINVSATGYTRFDPGCTDFTATGARAQRGVVAVDPRVIPLGTKLYIPGYGMAIAADTGGAIKGNRIDLCYDAVSEAYSWGVRNVTVYIVE